MHQWFAAILAAIHRSYSMQFQMLAGLFGQNGK